MNLKVRDFSLYKLLQEYVTENCNENTAYYISENPENEESIIALRREAFKDEIEYLLDNDLGCPIKCALTFFKKVNTETIQKALKNVDMSEYRKSSDLLAISEILIYLSTKCKFMKKGIVSENILGLLIIANIFKTLDLSKELFHEYVRSCFNIYNTIPYFDVENAWNYAQNNIPKYVACEYCIEDSLFSNDYKQEENIDDCDE